MSFGTPHRHYRRTDSTNTRARELAEGGAPGGTVVTAAEQTAGRGRQGRAWTAPPGKALLYSAILRPLGDRPLLPLAVALAVSDAVEDLAPGAGCRIKWPNDIWIGERKLAGILIETKAQDDWAAIGVGLNLTIEPAEFPPELRNTATSLTIADQSLTVGLTPLQRGQSHSHRKCGGAALSPHGARVALDSRLGEWLAADSPRVLAAYRERDGLREREIAWSAGPDLGVLSGSGVAVGIDDRGGLVVRLPGGGSTVLFAGEVHLRL